MVPTDEETTYVIVRFLLQLVTIPLGNELESYNAQEFIDVDVPETTHQCGLVFFDTGALIDEFRNREVGRHEARCTRQLWCLVLLVDRKTGLIADGLDEVDGQSLHTFVVEVLEHHMRVTLWVVQVEELVVQVFLEVRWVYERQHSCLSRTRVSVTPNMRVTVGLEEVTLLVGHSLQTLAVDEEVARVLGEGFFFFTFFDEVSHVDEDLINFALFLEVAGSGFFLGRFIGRELSQLKEKGVVCVDLGERFDMVSAPSAVREIAVAWYKIVTVSLADVKVLEDGRLADSVVVDETDVGMTDLVVVVGWSGANLKTSDKNVSKLSGIILALGGVGESSDIFVRLQVETGVPLTVLSGELDLGCWVDCHGQFENEVFQLLDIRAGKLRQFAAHCRLG